MDLESELGIVISQVISFFIDEDSVSEWALLLNLRPSKFVARFSQLISLIKSMDLDSQPKPESELISLIKQIIHFGNSIPDDDSGAESRFVSLITRMISLISSTESDPQQPELMSLTTQILSSAYSLDSDSELLSLITQLANVVNVTYSKPKAKQDPESKLISLITHQLLPLIDTRYWMIDQILKIVSHIALIISLVISMDLNSQPKPESELMSLVTQTVSLFNSMDLDSQPMPLRDVITIISQNFDHRIISTNSYPEYSSLFREVLTLEPMPELLLLIHQILSLVASMNLKGKKLISLCPQVEVRLREGRFHVDEEVSLRSNNMWDCLPLNWEKLKLPGEVEAVLHFRCRNCNGENHTEYNKASVEIKHPLHPKHSLQLVLLKGKGTRECYCCDEDLLRIFYYCFACDYAMNIACVEKPRVLSIDYPKWHEHTLALFPRNTSLTCSVCALSHTSCPFYICPPCDFVVHQRCVSLPRLIRISRHPHRISFTLCFGQGDWSCGVCRRKIDNDYGGYSCIKDGCSYGVHSRCATQRNVWDGKELEGEPEEDIEEVEPFVRISDGIIQHFSHQHHHLRLDDNTCRDYDENKQCQACITPIYYGNIYSCMQCDFILHEACANFFRKVHHPIHPHLLTLVGGNNGVMNLTKSCSACPWLCTAGFFYRCDEEECLYFKLHVQCAVISEPLVNESHMHPLFLTSKPGERRPCSVCKELSEPHITNETFNCIECDFALCFKCATLPQYVRYKHDEHILTLSDGKETSIVPTYWCEVCEKQILPRQRFYICDESCCVTLHIKCLIGKDLYMKPGSSWFFFSKELRVLPNNHHMSRPVCTTCKQRCSQKVIFHHYGLVFCSTFCIRDLQS
ncbi:PREDICTED: uncharacterized protein LOC104736127 [Camelina sativa]|uniref:Uncharacterized protein LOC104736127 n=1 Tax=Camelina sativa TaxID=90675 RepID=A0ABM0VD10_CAMSA|nr:PREDICTED: uncharacterized protein LOC104736127 [Camelina sativa]